MFNPATMPTPKWNEFTQYVKDNPGVHVKLRNGYFVQPIFHEAEDEHCSDGFHTSSHRWQTNGISIQSRNFDMMEITNEEMVDD